MNKINLPENVIKAIGVLKEEGFMAIEVIDCEREYDATDWMGEIYNYLIGDKELYKKNALAYKVIEIYSK